ncbi:SH3 domain-containing protein [Sediminimonas qiaohouensis]|uniref:SH3 domain-containing protein n=1 Tax=Sediminimonas qiaohouensis TaxID=552061 RepID=UPI00040C8AD0|nr:SH3 domain-containing protein [Sediminimonas qiaohouensis]
MIPVIRPIIAALIVFAAPMPALAQMDGHGPDAWMVSGVASDDTLNVRTGPGTDHLVIGTFAHDATGLRMITCVPYLPRRIYHALSDSQRADLPPRWCLMESAESGVSGWVSAHYLAEDTSAAQTQMDPLVARGVALVRRLYDQRQRAQRGETAGPLAPPAARDYFFADLVARLSGPVGADPLFGTQDADVEGLRIRPAPERAMHRGLVTVHAKFRNFGQPQTAIFRLRVDPALDPPALRIMRIEHQGWSFP